MRVDSGATHSSARRTKLSLCEVVSGKREQAAAGIVKGQQPLNPSGSHDPESLDLKFVLKPV